MNKKPTPSFEEIYKDYKAVRERIEMITQIGKPGQTYHVNVIHPEDLIRGKELAKLLIEKFANEVTDPAELFEISKDADEHCVCGHQIFIHGSLIPPTGNEMKFIHDGPCLIGSCGCKQYNLSK